MAPLSVLRGGCLGCPTGFLDPAVVEVGTNVPDFHVAWRLPGVSRRRDLDKAKTNLHESKTNPMKIRALLALLAPLALLALIGACQLCERNDATLGLGVRPSVEHIGFAGEYGRCALYHNLIFVSLKLPSFYFFKSNGLAQDIPLRRTFP